MADVESTAQERALALRAEALEICDRFAWPPQCIGSGSFEAGVREIYSELRLLQKVRAVHVSQALIDCCRRHRQWFPLFEDVQARIWMFLGERERAEQQWQTLLHHSSPAMRKSAETALKSLETKRLSGQMLATDVAQALDRNLTERVNALLSEAMLKTEDMDEPWLQVLLESTALKMPVPESLPWDRKLLTNQLMLDLFDLQLAQWEKLFDA